MLHGSLQKGRPKDSGKTTYFVLRFDKEWAAMQKCDWSKGYDLIGIDKRGKP
jgi:hypothetical protein